MNPPDSFDIRYSKLEDLEHLQKWFSNEGATDDFPFGDLEKEDALKNWIGYSRFNASITGTLDSIPCAIATVFLMPYKKVAHHASFYIMVDPKHRNMGIGTSMVRNICHLAKTRFRLESIHIEIYEPSLLLPILLRQGFELFARQEDFMEINGVKKARLLLEKGLKDA